MQSINQMLNLILNDCYVGCLYISLTAPKYNGKYQRMDYFFQFVIKLDANHYQIYYYLNIFGLGPLGIGVVLGRICHIM
jgi:hypothetical protein